MRTLSMTAVLCAMLAVAGCHHASGASSDGGGGGGSGGSDDMGAGTGDGGTGQSCANGQSCPSGQYCVGGTCVCPPYQAFCNGMCIPVANDANNCGGCGVQCTGALACSGGKCESSCLPGLTICSNACVDTKNDNDHCGNCTTKCPADQGCSDGACVPAVKLGPPPAMCANGGPPINVGPGGGNACAGNIAQNTFTWALCSCKNVALSDLFFTDAFDSTQGPYMPGGLGGGVGLNGSLNASSEITVGGTLWNSAATGLSTSSQADVLQELHVGGPLNAQMSVNDDAYVKGNISGGPVTIKKTLYHPGGATGVSGATYAAIVDKPVSVPPPCDYCAGQPQGLIPVPQIVAARQSNNDNALIGLDPAVFTKGGAPGRLDLPCGNYYLNAIQNSGALTIYAHGHVALYVGGDISGSSTLALTLAPDATFDIFVAGTVNTSSALLIGSPNYPALTRTYVGGTANLTFSDNVSLSGNLYDGAARLDWSSGVDAYGAVYAGDFSGSSAVRIHYDRQVTVQGQGCPPAAPDGGTTSCGSCKECNNQACINGTCGACGSSADCCAPLVCTNGSCVLPIQ